MYTSFWPVTAWDQIQHPVTHNRINCLDDGDGDDGDGDSEFHSTQTVLFFL